MAKQQRESVVANSFVLTDERGRSRALLSTDSDGNPFFQLHDKDGLPRILMSLQSNGEPQLGLLDADGNGDVTLTARASGAFGICVSRKGMPLVEIGVDYNDETGLCIRDQTGDIVWQVASRGPNP